MSSIRAYGRALSYQEKALAIRLSTLGEQHPDVAANYTHIGLVYYDAGDYDQALDFYNKSLEIKLATLGEQHLDVALAYSSLGYLYRNKGA